MWTCHHPEFVPQTWKLVSWVGHLFTSQHLQIWTSLTILSFQIGGRWHLKATFEVQEEGRSCSWTWSRESWSKRTLSTGTMQHFQTTRSFGGHEFTEHGLEHCEIVHVCSFLCLHLQETSLKVQVQHFFEPAKLFDLDEFKCESWAPPSWEI